MTSMITFSKVESKMENFQVMCSAPVITPVLLSSLNLKTWQLLQIKSPTERQTIFLIKLYFTVTIVLLGHLHYHHEAMQVRRDFEKSVNSVLGLV